MFTSFRLRVRGFFRTHKRKIFAILLVWAIILIANDFLRSTEFTNFQRSTYKEHTSIMGGGEEVPTLLKEPINELIDTYFNYCNTKQYNKAYEMLSQGCKDVYYPTLEDFKKYVDLVFNEDKVYYLQNFANYNNIYIYRLRIMENLLKTGLTGEEDVQFYEEKVALKQEADGKLSLSIRQYITTEDIAEVYEDNYLKIWIEKKDVFYEGEIYTVRIRNKSENIAVLADNSVGAEIGLKVSSSTRTPNNNNFAIILQSGETAIFKIDFTKFYDDYANASSMVFNAVRIINANSGTNVTNQNEIDNIVKLYSIEIPF